MIPESSGDTIMLTKPALAACAFIAIALSASPAMTADLAARSSIGEIFAERPVHDVRVQQARARGYEEKIVETLYAIQPHTPGYYGKPGDFEYHSYYGTSPVTIFARLPYACGYVGQC
jgi:hypothetical protein